jgi:hypothetical protein
MIGMAMARGIRMSVHGRTAAMLVVMALAAGTARAGDERLWLAQAAPTAADNAGAMQMQEQLIDQLRRVQVDVPEGYVMTLDQINRLNALFAMNEGLVSTRDGAKEILGLD